MGQEEKEAGQHDVRSVAVHSPVGAGQQAQPRRGDGNGDGPSGTAMAAARGGTRQSWQRRVVVMGIEEGRRWQKY
jgi:hypothetical protein